MDDQTQDQGQETQEDVEAHGRGTKPWPQADGSEDSFAKRPFPKADGSEEVEG
jgi:hypothetical protein